jgi:3-hydroxyacyl-CoA dehydrogenase/enoyl-CoA hydratase/carnithine racemase
MNATWDNIELLIVGAGTMGSSLAQNYAQNGFNVGMLDVSDAAVANGFATIDNELAQARGRIFSPQQIITIRSQIIGGTDYENACRSRNLQIVIEAATERVDIKESIFRRLDELTPHHVVLATNSSSLDANILARVTRRPEKVVWMHYFYLPHKNRAAEYAGTDTASESAKQIARRYLKLGGKIPTHIRNSRKGGVADVIFVSLLLEATRMVEEGFELAAIEEAGKRAYDIPIGFLSLMDSTGLPIGLYSMRSFSDAARPDDPLLKAYGNFFQPRKNYIDLIQELEQASDKSKVRWIRKGTNPSIQSISPRLIEELTERFLAIGFLTATECVDAGLITVDDLELLTQNAFLWRRGPFTIMNALGSTELRQIINARCKLAEKLRHDFPVSRTLRRAMDARTIAPSLLKVSSEKELDGAVRRVTLSNPRAANAVDNSIFEELNRQFSEANEDDACKVIVFDTAPIKTFIAGASIPAFIERIKSNDIESIVRETREWQRVIFHVMTGTPKPKIAIVDGQAFGGGVELACAFASDPNSVVLVTDRTSFSLPETRLGIYPGLRGTLTLPQLIFKKTGDAETALALSRYFMLAGGTTTSSPQMVFQLGCADAIVPQHRRDDAAEIIANAIAQKNGLNLSPQQFSSLKFERLHTEISADERLEWQIAKDLFSQSDLIPTLYAQARGNQPVWFTGNMKASAQRTLRRVASNSPNAVWMANYLVSRGFECHLNGIDNDTLAEFELNHYLQQVFEHPDALIGLEAVVQGRSPEFKRRYPI